MNQLKGKRVIISGLVSSKLNLGTYLLNVRDEIKKLGGIIVGELIQRRGVSRSKQAGGSQKLNLPLNSRTYITTGKIEELKQLCNNVNAEVVIFINDLTNAQLNNIEHSIDLKIIKIDVSNKIN